MEKGNVLSVRAIDYGEEDWKRIKILGKGIFSEMEKDAKKGNIVEGGNCYGQGLMTL